MKVIIHVQNRMRTKIEMLAEFLTLNNSPSIFGTTYYHFNGYHDEKLVRQEQRAWSECKGIQAVLSLNW